MSMKELTRLEVVQKVVGKQLLVKEASTLLGITERQIKRITRTYRHEGAPGLLSKHRSKAGNNRISSDLKSKILQVIYTKYADFGPTLACEKLREIEGLIVSKETLRQWMQEVGLRKRGHRKKTQLHQMRERRSCLGELVQIDGSPHDWFEGRRDKCCLLVFIDDATSRIQQLRFEESETTFGYFAATRDYLMKHGRPLSFYSDKYGVFRINIKESTKDTTTQFERAMKALDIEIICADTPQAKGRVERANGILQDRLVKELRLRGINDIETANAFLHEFAEDYNRRFAVAPKSDINAHRQVLPTEEAMDLIFSLHEQRKLSKNLELSYKNEIFQIKCTTPGYTMRQANVTVCEARDSSIRLIYKGRSMEYARHKKNQRPVPIVNPKNVNKVVDKLTKPDGRTAGHKPASNHPWRKYEQIAAKMASQDSLARGAVTHNPTEASV